MLKENLFASIGKLIASAFIQKDIKKAIRQADNDPELQSTLQSIKYHTDRLKDLQNNHCQKFPTSPQCKNKKKVRYDPKTDTFKPLKASGYNIPLETKPEASFKKKKR